MNFMNLVDEKLAEQIEKLNVFLEKADMQKSAYPNFEAWYKRIIKERDRYYPLNWNQILRQHPELNWVQKCREDRLFKQYYQLRAEIDRLQEI